MSQCWDLYICRDCMYLEFPGESSTETYKKLMEMEESAEDLEPLQRGLINVHQKLSLNLEVHTNILVLKN